MKKPVKILFITDPLENFNINKDSTFSLIKASFSRGYEVYQAGIEDLLAEGPSAKVLAREIFLNIDLNNLNKNWFEFKNFNKSKMDLNHFNLVFMRKDPPFNMNYIYATYLLELAEKSGVKIINSPRALRDANEKCFILNFPEFITRTLVSSDISELKNFLVQEGEVIYKPLDGMGGMSVFKIKLSDPNLSVVLELLTHNGSMPIMAQRYIPEIKNGDKRILLINGEAISHGLSRIPKEGETRGNLAAGARGEVRELNQRELEVCKKIGPELKKMGLLFVGLDMIGDYITEINITSPTGIQEIEKVVKQDIAGKILDAGFSS